LALSTATHVEHAQAIVMRQVLDDVQGLQSTTAQSVQVDDAFTIHNCLVILQALPTMSNECAFYPLVPSVLHLKQIFNYKSVLIEIEG
jgi:hypothetical protein